jgi:hypothetical protein
MNETLYDKIFELDSLSERSDQELADKKIELYVEYKHNQIFLEAFEGKKTIAKSLEELSKPNEGFGIYLPRPKNSEHNKKVLQMHKLVEKRGSLSSNGILYPDNMVNGAIYFGVLAYYISSAAIDFFMEGRVNEYNREFSEQIKAIMPYAFTILASFGGGMICGWNRNERMGECSMQANCIDERIKKYYHNNDNNTEK